MKLKVLEDNNTFIGMYYLGEPGLSYYIEDGEDRILFDTGYSDAFLRNAEKMNVDMDIINKVVISHGHDDHTGGLKYFFAKERSVELITHPGSFSYNEDNTGLYIGSTLSKEELSKVCKLNLTKVPVKVSKNITYLGEIPTLNDFETKGLVSKDSITGEEIYDSVEEDSALVYKDDKGLFIITGCSHSGICNIVEFAKKVCGENKILGVIGGFHLLENNETLKDTIKYFKDNNIKYLYPCHCVSLKGKVEMAKQLEIFEVGVGLEIEL